MLTIDRSIVIPYDEYERHLKVAEEFHGHLCPGMYTGVKMTLLAKKQLGYETFPSKDLMVITEIDRCLTDAIIAISGTRLGRRTLKFRDYGKFAATFCSLEHGQGIRFCQKESFFGDIRALLEKRNIDIHKDKEAASRAFFDVPWQEHFSVEIRDVIWNESDLPGQFKVKVVCESCREPVMDERHVMISGKPFCKPCAARQNAG